jgi:Cu/Ag efflux pump CusA
MKLDQVVKTAGEAVWSSPLTYLNSSTPGTGGFIDTPNQRLNIRHRLPIATAGTFREVVVNGTNTRLGDVTHVLESHQPLIGDAVIGDQPGLMLAIEKLPGYNTVDVTRAVERAIADLKPGLPGIEVDTTIYYPASFIERATGNLGKAMIIAIILAAIALGLLMNSLRVAFIAIVAISLSFVSAALLLQAVGIPFSMMVIAGLLLATSVIVHDGVLDSDNVLKRLRSPRNGRSTFLVIARAINESRRPMVYASVITLIAVVPILLLKSQSSAFFVPMAWAYSAAVLVSMAVALLVTPALAALLLANEKPEQEVRKPINQLVRLFEPFGVSASRAPVIGIGVGLAAAIACVPAFRILERNLVPSFKETDLVVQWESPPGTSLAAMTRVTSGLMADLRKIPGVQKAAANFGRAVLCNCDDAIDVNSGTVWVKIDPKADHEDTLEAIEDAIKGYPGMHGKVASYMSTKLREALTGNPDAITVRVYGNNLEVLRSKAAEIKNAMAKIPGIDEPHVESRIEEPAIEVKVNVDRAAKHGLKPGDVRRATSAMVGGITVGGLFEGQKVFDVVVWGRPETRGNLNDIYNLKIQSESGAEVPLSEVADVRIAPATSIIRREGALRRIDVTAQVDEERALGSLVQDLSSRIKQISFPFEHHAEILGEYAEQRAALRSIYGYAAAAAALMFLLTQAALGSWTLAALSLLGVPIAILGSLLAVAIGGGALSLGSLFGMGAVLALTLRQGIELVTYFQHLQVNEGEAFGEAVVHRGLREKFPSIVTSSVVTLAIVLPFAILGNVAGLEIAHPLAVAVTGGIIASTFAILFVVPALYFRFGAGWRPDQLDLEVCTRGTPQ